MMNFKDLGIEFKVADAIEDMGWTEPTPVQEAVVPAGLSGRDIFAQAQTGTGKTGTYASIILCRIKSRAQKPSAIVLAPTRELANQVDKEIKKLSKYSKHRSVPIYGGASISEQIYALKKGVDIVIGTPGRVKDMIDRGALDLSQITEVVLDEADRMLDIGFADELDYIMEAVPENRQTMLFSATMAKEIKEMASRITNDPLELFVSKDEPCSELIAQYFVQVSRSGKMERLKAIITNGNPKTIVFCQTKKMVDEVCSELSRDVKVEAIHGDMPQSKRERTIKNFRNDKCDVLVATDVAARGLDVNNIDCVVNYDVPADPETYLHRIGRTGRAGKEGIAISFVTKSEDHRVRMYERATGVRMMKIQIHDLEPIHREKVEVQRERPEFVERRTPVRTSDQKRQQPKKQKRSSLPYTLQVNLGKDDGICRMQISDLIMSNAKVSHDTIGRIGLGKTSSYFEINGNYAEYVMDALSDCNYGGKQIQVQIAPAKRPYSEVAAAKSVS